MSLKLPGFGLPLNHTTKSTKARRNGGVALFPNALTHPQRLTTLREFIMVRFMNQLTEKPGWDTKVFDETIVAKWKAEALAAPDIDMTERMFAYCVGELRYKSRVFQETGVIIAFDGAVAKSDLAIPSALRDALRTAVVVLEDVPPLRRDWHPGSKGMVLDLVHPSLFPVVYGQTRILKASTVGLGDCVERCGEGVTLSVPSAAKASQENCPANSFSRKFQWLPCEVDLSGDRATITSYINNLHPKLHKPLYAIIEQVIDLAIPLWNHTLSPLRSQRPPRVAFDQCEYDPDPELLPEEEQPQMLPDELEEDYWERKEEWIKDTRQLVMPEPAEFKEPQGNALTVNLKADFADRGIQVIVKLANIHLTPEKPEYDGGTWHVEGQLNEHICATALYYYDTSNITESVLSFRQQSALDDADNISYPQDEHQWLSQVFGCEQDGPATQHIGGVVAKDGRLLTFPNIFQHRVAPFKLADKTKPGHRKILALFLVDPHLKIISSARVPCQQKAWWADALVGGGVFSALPKELVQAVVDGVDGFPIGLDEAKALRVELMEERKAFTRDHGEAIQEAVFSLCEH